MLHGTDEPADLPEHRTVAARDGGPAGPERAGGSGPGPGVTPGPGPGDHRGTGGTGGEDDTGAGGGAEAGDGGGAGGGAGGPGAGTTRPDRREPRIPGSAAPEQATLFAFDGVRVSAAHWPPSFPSPPSTSGVHAADPDGTVFVVAHGFTGSWRRPAVGRVVDTLRRHGGVVGFDFRGHGASGGESTVGDREVLDLDAAVRWARALGYGRVVTIGFSMGGSVVLRHAALHTGVDAVVSVSAPARWYYRGTPSMRRVHFAIERRTGRLIARYAFRTRIARAGWNPVPLAPYEAAARIAPLPLLIVHGDHDPYFPLDHARQIFDATGGTATLWIEPGFGHAENAAGAALVDRVARWARERVDGERVDGERAGRARGERGAGRSGGAS